MGFCDWLDYSKIVFELWKIKSCKKSISSEGQRWYSEDPISTRISLQKTDLVKWLKYFQDFKKSHEQNNKQFQSKDKSDFWNIENKMIFISFKLRVDNSDWN